MYLWEESILEIEYFIVENDILIYDKKVYVICLEYYKIEVENDFKFVLLLLKLVNKFFDVIFKCSEC